MSRWAIRVVITDQMHTDSELMENGVVKGSDLVSGLLGVDEDIGRSIVRLRCQDRIIAGGNPHYNVTFARTQGVANKTPPLWPPRVHHLAIQVVCQQLGNSVLKPFQFPVGKGKVIGVGTDTKILEVSRRFVGPATRGEEQHCHYKQRSRKGQESKGKGRQTTN